MPGNSRKRPPAACRWMIWFAGYLTPACERLQWRSRHTSDLDSLWILIQRGEMPCSAPAQLAGFCLDSVAAAFGLRFQRDSFRRWMRGPGFFFTGCFTTLLLLAALTHGFEAARSVINAARQIHNAPLRPGVYDPRADHLFAYIAPVVLSLAINVILMGMILARNWLRSGNWRYWSFLVFKAILLMLVVSLLWVEGGAALRAQIPDQTARVIFGGLGTVILFVGASGWTALWTLADQRRRCPVCLRRLAMPVAIGSWASVFDPPTTEFLCAEGHGSLTLSELETVGVDRWSALDPSWKSVI